jgi:uncharacterized protein (TIGR03066 family)
MPSIKRLLYIFVIIAISSPARAGEGDFERLIGYWREIGSTEALIEFRRNGELTALFPRGDRANRLDGTWKLLPNDGITMTFTTDSRSLRQDGTLKFEGDEMVLIDDKGERTRHRRFTEPLPSWAK